MDCWRTTVQRNEEVLIVQSTVVATTLARRSRRFKKAINPIEVAYEKDGERFSGELIVELQL
jgi:hypothetical protein